MATVEAMLIAPKVQSASEITSAHAEEPVVSRRRCLGDG